MTNEILDNDALIQSDLAHDESTKPKLSLSEFLAREDLCKNSNGKYVPNNQQLKILVRYDEINLGDIDTSKITNMKDLFKNSTRQDFSGIEKWNVESVTTFMSAFDGAKHFNADISGWNVSNATNFMQMFWNATVFNQPIGKWKTTKATNTIRMFCNAKNFNQPLQEWDMSSVKWTWEMFAGAQNFNQPLDKWNVSNVEKMQSMFNRAESFNQDLSAWGDKLGKVQDMKRMFANTKSLNQTFAWKLNENCDLTNITKGSALKLEISFIDDDKQETLQDSAQSSEKVSTTKAQLASKITNFTIHQIVKSYKNISYEKYKNAVDSFINQHLKEYGRKELYSWIPKNIRDDYKIYLAKNENAVICGANEDKWDFICYKVFDYFFIVVSNNATLNIPQGLLKQHEKRTLTIKQEAIDEDDEDLEFGRDIHYKGNSLRISLEDNQEMYIYNGNSNQDIQNSDRILNIIGALILAKAYESKMYDFNKMARQAKGADLMKWHKEICAFDLKYYQNVPVLVYNAPLLEFWGKLANRYKINDRHNELQETIARVAQLVSDEMRERENKIREAENKKRDKISIAIGVATVIIGILSALGALPVIRNFFN